jgi:hypothetical protein
MANVNDDIRKELDAPDGQTIVLPSNVRIEVIECTGMLMAYQHALNRASEQVDKAMIIPSPPIVEPIDRDKAWDELVIGGNKWPPKDAS